ncbi:hypothetical protein Tco_0516722 [Tanacetum coccineum]
MSIQDMEDLKQQYLDGMKSMINQIQIKDYCNERIDIRYRRECEIKIDELKGKFNGMSIKINKKKELRQLEQAATFDSLLEEFSGELAHIDLISTEIDKADFDPEEEIHLVEKLLYDNSSPRPPEEFNSENSDAVIESFSPSPILVEGSDSLIEEIDIFLTPDDSMPPGMKNDDYDSEGDILFLEELLSNDSPLLPKNESFHFDVPSSPRPPTKPPDDNGIYFDAEPDTGILTLKLVDDISEHYLISDFFKSPMMIYGGNIQVTNI